MIITSARPFSAPEIEKLAEEFDPLIKTVIDIERQICSAGANRHFENEKILLERGSRQFDLWGGGVDRVTLEVSIDSMINIRPGQGNRSNQIQDPATRERFDGLTKYFFPTIFND